MATTRPMHMDGKSVAAAIDAARTTNSKHGKTTFSGTGAQTVFLIPHGLGAIPTGVSVEAGSVAGATPFFVTVDATNITVTYTTAPATGTNNVVLFWIASA